MAKGDTSPKKSNPTFSNIYRDADPSHAYFEDIPFYCDYLWAVIHLFEFKCTRMVDVGCGNGEYGRYITQRWQGRVKKYIGYDIDTRLIDGLDSNHFKQGDLMSIPESRPFDVVLCHSVLQYVDDIDEACAKLHRLVKPKGFVSIFQTLTLEDYRCYKAVANWHDDYAYQRAKKTYLNAILKYFDIISYGILVPKGAYDSDPYKIDKLFIRSAPPTKKRS